jgi:hypothetical protein
MDTRISPPPFTFFEWGRLGGGQNMTPSQPPPKWKAILGEGPGSTRESLEMIKCFLDLA